MATVFVIEDDELIRECMLDMLSEQGFTTVGAANGRDALDQIRAGLRPDLILLDLMMPVMNGWDFRIEQVKEPDQQTVPVVIVTGSGEERRALEQLSAAGTLRKPFTPSQLEEVVRRHIRS